MVLMGDTAIGSYSGGDHMKEFQTLMVITNRTSQLGGNFNEESPFTVGCRQRCSETLCISSGCNLKENPTWTFSKMLLIIFWTAAEDPSKILTLHISSFVLPKTSVHFALHQTFLHANQVNRCVLLPLDPNLTVLCMESKFPAATQ